MTLEQLASLKARITPGPWRLAESASGGMVVTTKHGALAKVYNEPDSFFAGDVGAANSDAIALVPELVDALLARQPRSPIDVDRLLAHDATCPEIETNGYEPCDCGRDERIRAALLA